MVAATSCAGGARGPLLPAPCGAVEGDDCLRPGGLWLTDRLVALAGLPAAAAVLDVGCGAGATVAHLADEGGLHPVGLDASEAQVLRACAARPDLDFVVGRAERLPFAAGSFDAVLSECVLATLADAVTAVAEMVRVLRADGALLLSDLYVRGDPEATPPGKLPSLGRRESVEGLLDEAGLSVVVWEDQTGELGRYVWETAGSCTAASSPAHEMPPAPGATPNARRLGYFIVVARPAAGQRGAS
jgi:SAM-dependent methyltransferase